MWKIRKCSWNKLPYKLLDLKIGFVFITDFLFEINFDKQLLLHLDRVVRHNSIEMCTTCAPL